MSDNNSFTAFAQDIGNLRSDCKNCFGLCCVALYFLASDGFPADKDAGSSCVNLQQDFRCLVYESLKERGFRGCLSFDCFGAGQKVSQVSFDNKSWLQYPELSKQMFDMFLRMRQLHEFLWYLNLALTYRHIAAVRDKLESKIMETERLSLLSPGILSDIDMPSYISEIYKLLFTVSKLVRSAVRHR